jgi:hypothetical protein
MTMARAHLVDPSVTRWYHCVTRCVRRAFLLGEGPVDRKEWIERRLQELAAFVSGQWSVAKGQPPSRHLSVRPHYAPQGDERLGVPSPGRSRLRDKPVTYTRQSIAAWPVFSRHPPRALKAAEHGSVAGSNSSAGLEESIWLCPIEDRHKLDSSREGMLEGFSLGSYLILVDYTGRLFRDGKAVISAELSGIL